MHGTPRQLCGCEHYHRRPEEPRLRELGRGVRKRTAEPGDPLDKGRFLHRSPLTDGRRDVISATPEHVLSLSEGVRAKLVTEGVGSSSCCIGFASGSSWSVYTLFNTVCACVRVCVCVRARVCVRMCTRTQARVEVANMLL